MAWTEPDLRAMVKTTKIIEKGKEKKRSELNGFCLATQVPMHHGSALSWRPFWTDRLRRRCRTRVRADEAAGHAGAMHRAHKWYKSIVGRSGKKIKGVARRESGGGRKTVAVAIQPNRIWNPASPPTTTATQQATYPSSSSRNVTDKWAHEDGVGPVPGWTPCCMQLALA